MEKTQVNNKGKKLLAILLAVFLLAAAAAGLWYVKTVDADSKSFLPPCLFHEFTGLYCTGCGITRALHHLMNGHIIAALRMNPLAVISLPFLIWFSSLLFYRLYRNRPLPGMPTWMPWAILAVIILYTVARNLPWEPFSWLAPTEINWVR